MTDSTKLLIEEATSVVRSGQETGAHYIPYEDNVWLNKCYSSWHREYQHYPKLATVSVMCIYCYGSLLILIVEFMHLKFTFLG